MKHIGRYLFNKRILFSASGKQQESSIFHYFIYDDDTRTKLDLNGEIEPVGDLMYDSSSEKGYAVFHYNHRNDSHWGVINEFGEIIIPPIYNRKIEFVNGTAIVSKEGSQTGVIDSLGHEVIPLIYGSIKRSKEYYEAETQQELVLFDFNGSIICKQYKCAARSENNAFGLVRKDTDEFIVRPEYQSINSVTSPSYPYDRIRAFIVCRNGKFGLLDSIGKMIIDCCLDVLERREERHSNDELLFFREGDRSGYFDYSLEQHFFKRFGIYELFYNSGPGIRLFKNKEILVQPIPGKSLSYLGDNLFLVYEGNKDCSSYTCGVINDSGKEVTPFHGRHIIYLEEGVIIYYPQGYTSKPVLFDKEGRILVDSLYDSIEGNRIIGNRNAIYGKYLLVSIYKNFSRSYGLIDISGKELLEPKNRDISLFPRIKGFIINSRTILDNELAILCCLPPYSSLYSDYFEKAEKAVIRIGKDGSYSYGLVSISGSFSMLPCTSFEYIEYSNENRIKVYDKGQGYGFTNELGNIVVPLRYNEVHSFIDGKAYVRFDTDYGYINKEGELLLDEAITLPIEYDWGWLYDDFIIAIKDGVFGCLKKNLRILLPFKYSSKEEVINQLSTSISMGPYNKIAKPFIDSSTNLFGLLSENEEVLVPAIFEEILGVQKKDRYHDVKNPINHHFQSMLIPAKLNSRWGYIDTDGRTVIPFKYDKADFFSEGLAIVTLIEGYNVSHGFINQKGEMVISLPLKDKILSGFRHGTATIEINPCTPGKDNYEVSINKRGEYLD